MSPCFLFKVNNFSNRSSTAKKQHKNPIYDEKYVFQCSYHHRVLIEAYTK
jgi:hypothetical protein